jgi:hypothetical protein
VSENLGGLLSKKTVCLVLKDKLLENSLSDFLAGKTEHSQWLFQHLIAEFEAIGEIRVHATKSMICIGRERNFAYVIYLGENFVDLVLPFKQTFPDNLCFQKIKLVPGSADFNHHLRIYHAADFNQEVREYMRMAWERAS